MSVAILPWAWMDGRLVRSDAPASPLNAPALLLGEGLFETMACERGAPLLFPWHYERLARSAKALGLRLKLKEGALFDASARTVARNGKEKAVARLMLLRGARRDSVAIVCRPLGRPSPKAYARGVRLLVAPWRRAEGVEIRCHKTLSYWENLRARKWAQKRGAFDALFLTPDGHVLEGGVTNVFCIRDGTLLTPPVAMGLLPGVMRRFVMTVARRLFGMRVLESRLKLGDLEKADEVFVTNAAICALPVGRFGKHRTKTGPSTSLAFLTSYHIATRQAARTQQQPFPLNV